MKKITTSTLLLFLCVSSFTLCAQNTPVESIENDGEYPMRINDANNPCITPEQYQIIEKQCAENIKLLGLENAAHKTMATSLSWPLRMANGLNDLSYYYVVNYVDQDPSSGLKDYNCGTTRTYDGHRGMDICPYPYQFYKMDNNQVEVIAAAPGTIIAKADGNFDKNCNGFAATTPANYIIVQHADGSKAWYYHMKKNTVTVKTIGQTVVTGEYLGVVGSSGYSTGPHLHFEILTAGNAVNDPYSGTCNTLNSTSWWAVQKPYKETAIIKASVNSAAPVIPACPATETPNEDSCFTSPGTASFLIFIRDEKVTLTAYMRIINPDLTTFDSWTYYSPTNNPHVKTRTFIRTLPTAQGIYTFEAVYNGDTTSTVFKINCGSTTGIIATTALSKLQVSPNPANSTLNIEGESITNGSYKLTLKNVIGQVTLLDNATVENNSIKKSFPISEFPNGIYFMTIETEKTRIVKKIIIQNQ